MRPSAVRLLFALLFACALPALAVDVAGPITQDTTWSRAGGPWHLTSDVTVAAGATLTIEAGAQVVAANADPPVQLVVRGALVAEGSSSQRITFRSDGGWRNSWGGVVLASEARRASLQSVDLAGAQLGLDVQTSGQVALRDVRIDSVTTGLRWASTQAASVDGLQIKRFQDAGLDLAGQGALTVTGALFQSGYGTALLVHPGASADVRRSTFVANRLAVQLQEGGSLAFTNNVVAGNLSGGLRLKQGGQAQVRVVNNTIDRNAARPTVPQGGDVGGVWIEAVTNPASFLVRNNVVTNHGTTGIRVDGGQQPTLDTNLVWNNQGADYQGTSGGTNARSADPRYKRPLFDQPPPANAQWQVVQVGLQVRPQGAGQCPNYVGHWYVEWEAGWVRLDVANVVAQGATDAVVITDLGGTQLSRFTNGQGGASVAAPGGNALIDVTLGICGSGEGFDLPSLEWLPMMWDYRVQAGSPAIDAGSSAGAPGEDFLGTQRPVDGDATGGAQLDLGAYEFNENQPPIANAGSDVHARPGQTVSFDASASRDPDGTIQRYEWNFGDGSAPVRTAIATHAFPARGVYAVTLTVTDDHGATGQATVQAFVQDSENQLPVVRPGGPYSAPAGAEIAFDGSASSDPDGSITAYRWDFGDGKSADGAKAAHVYASAGRYVATLTCTDNAGDSATASVSVLVTGSTGNLPPIAKAGGNQQAAVGDVLTFDAGGSSDADGTIKTFRWDFGDGASSGEIKAQHAYSDAGVYTVRLTVTDDAGALGQDVATVYVRAPQNRPPQAKAGDDVAAFVGDQVHFDGSQSSDVDGTIRFFLWDFGDGQTANGMTATHAYSVTGTFHVKLTVVDDKGSEAFDTLQVVVQERRGSSQAAPGGCGCTGVGDAGAIALLALFLQRRARYRVSCAA